MYGAFKKLLCILSFECYICSVILTFLTKFYRIRMSWKNYFSTSIGKKLQMSLTGIFLIVFLIVHCYVNAQIFYFDGGVRFLEAAHFMGTNMLIRTTEIGLFA